MSALVLMGLLLVGAKPSKPVSLPMPPPPVVNPKPPPEPAAAPAPAPPPVTEVKAEAPRPADRATLLSKIRISGGLGPAFTLGGGGVSPQGSTPVWLRGSLRGTLDLARLGPGVFQAVVPIGVQGAGFRENIFGILIAGSLFGADVMPSVRYQAEVLQDLALFAELGLGFGFYQVTIQQQFLGYQSGGASGFGVRIGAGLEYRLLDQIRLLFQPMEVASLTVSTTQNGTTTTQGISQWGMIVGLVVSL